MRTRIYMGKTVNAIDDAKVEGAGFLSILPEVLLLLLLLLLRRRRRRRL